MNVIHQIVKTVLGTFGMLSIIYITAFPFVLIGSAGATDPSAYIHDVLVMFAWAFFGGPISYAVSEIM